MKQGFRVWGCSALELVRTPYLRGQSAFVRHKASPTTKTLGFSVSLLRTQYGYNWDMKLSQNPGYDLGCPYWDPQLYGNWHVTISVIGFQLSSTSMYCLLQAPADLFH